MALENILNKGILLHGIGSGVFKTVSGKAMECTTSQSMKMNVTATTEDVYGGDGLFPLYTYISKKEGSVEIQNAEFKLSQLAIAQEVAVKTAGAKKTYRVLVTKDDTEAIAGATLTGVEVIAIIGPDGQVSTDLTVSDTGALTFSADAVAGEYSLWFKADDADATEASMLKNAMPEVASFNWMFTTVASDGQEYQVDLYARRVRANGEFQIETGRDSAGTPSLTVNILDPGDGRDDFAVITISKVRK